MSKNLAEEVKNTTALIQKGLNTPKPWLVENKTSTNSFINNIPSYTAAFQNNNIKNIDSSKIIKQVYMPAFNKILPNINKGIRLLMEAQTQFEGFAPGTKSYRTNNPGNINNTDAGGQRFFPTLEKGIEGQYKHILKVVNNQEPNYILNKRKIAPGTTDIATGKQYPGIDFTYTGKLKQYLQIYSTGARADNNYLNFIIGYFKNNGISITGDTTLQEIASIK